jgi:hypothetical protein
MQIDIEVESELYRVHILIAGANQLIEPPAPYRIHLGPFECLELNRSHPVPLDPLCCDYHLVVPTALKVNPSSE